MGNPIRKKRDKTSLKIRKSEENEVNLIPFSPERENNSPSFLGFKLKNVNQLWRWDTLEDVKF
jgi:hypothetical protein